MWQAGGSLEGRVPRERVELVEVRKRSGNDLTLPTRLARELRRRRIAVLHTHCWGTLLEGIAAAKLSGVRTIVHGEHGTIEQRPRNVFAQRWLWRMATQVTAVSDSLADRLAKVIGFPRARIHVIPNGVDTDHFRPAPEQRRDLRAAIGLSQEAFAVGIVARLVPVKNHAGLIRAVGQLRQSDVFVHLLIAGDGPLENELRQLAGELGVAEQVHFLGEVQDVRRVLNAMDVFVLNSYSEGMSNTVLEAMSQGLPIVATRVGSTPQLIEDGISGLLVSPDDVEGLSRALLRLVQSSGLCQTLGPAARKRAEERFSIASMVDAYSELYLRLAAGQSRQRASAPARAAAI
jgi:sugar transferase (PEP-CTERM/EpsH1 system associated)